MLNEGQMEGAMLQVLNSEKLRSLEQWLQESSITLKQINGQRKYGGPPPGWRGPTPGQGCEVFISHIPRDIYEDRLIPLFQRVAPLYEFRLMMNFSGQNRGFAYAKYGDTSSAAEAIKALHLYPLQAGVKLTVRWSTEKKQLCLGDLPSTMQRKDLISVLCRISSGVEDVATGYKETDACAVVSYTSHYAASMAKKILVEAFRRMYGLSISVRWMPCSPRSRHNEQWEEAPFTLSRFHISPDPAPPPSPPVHPLLFSRAVADPALQMGAMMVPQNLRSTKEPSSGFVHQLRWLCEQCGLGLPAYNVQYHHTGPDGFLYFNYRVKLPGLPNPFCGIVNVLPSTNCSNMEAEVHEAVTEQLFKTVLQVKKP